MMVASAVVVVCVLALSACLADARPVQAELRQEGSVLAGYTFSTNVREHSEIDLDVAEMETAADSFDFETAARWYTMGGNSEKTSSTRTLRGFSVDLPVLLPDDAFYAMFSDYWGSGTYADAFVTAALEGTGDFDGAPDIVRAECAVKGAQYQNVWMYVYRELADAKIDCDAGAPTENDDPAVTAWDEAWAFYAGSQEESDGSGSGSLIHALAEKRCVDFGTCAGSGNARVNQEILALFKQGQAVLAGDNVTCSDLDPVTVSIREKMVAPVLQGVLRYAWLADPNGGNSDSSDKAWAEGWAFCAAVLPVINDCSSSAAETLINNFDIANSGPVPDGYEAVADAVFSTLACLNLDCNDIGNLESDGETRITCSTSGGSGSGDDDGVCFPGDAVVELEGGRVARMSELAVGDKVRVSSNEFSEVHAFGHRETKGVFSFMKFQVDLGENVFAELEVSGNHFIRVNGAMSLARDVTVGDTVHGIGGPGRVVSISKVTNIGLYSPLTLHGEIAVNSIIASCYTSALHPTIASALLVPVRLLYRLLSVNIIGRSLYGRVGARVARFLGLPLGLESL